MCACMCVQRMCVYACLCMYPQVCLWMCACKSKCKHSFLSVCVCACMCPCTQVVGMVVGAMATIWDIPPTPNTSTYPPNQTENQLSKALNMADHPPPLPPNFQNVGTCISQQPEIENDLVITKYHTTNGEWREWGWWGAHLCLGPACRACQAQPEGHTWRAGHSMQQGSGGGGGTRLCLGPACRMSSLSWGTYMEGRAQYAEGRGGGLTCVWAQHVELVKLILRDIHGGQGTVCSREGGGGDSPVSGPSM